MDNVCNTVVEKKNTFIFQFFMKGKSGITFENVPEYVKALNGKRSIQRVLIANNGISAVKAIRSIRLWAYEMFCNDRMIEFLVMATPEDLRANAEYIRMADQVVEVPGGSNNNNYANVMLIVEIAMAWQVDAVFVGWGHASEMPILPDTLIERGIIFIGPPGKPMRALGDKIGSTIIAQSANVPTIAWNGDGIKIDYGKEGKVPDDVYAKGSIDSVEDAIVACNRIGYPVMIKASEGGGGKGIRKVVSEDGVAAGFTAVQGEIPGSPIFVMRLAPKSRHLEVQLLADEYGEAISLSGRDCSVQRRHQKIVEEGPVVSPPMHVWKQMEAAATRLAKAVEYVNAGTVEYLYVQDDSSKESFYFLELNPRLQVEHPVTEMITGVNLPAAQLQVAMGIPLHRIPDVRRLYNKIPFESSKIAFDKEEQAPPNGHVIAARITAENPDAGFQPTSGAIEELNFRSTPDVWGYFSVDSSGRVHEYADSQIGHLFSWGLSRNQARKNMIVALKELSIRGDIRTTVEYIVKMMESEDFSENNISTSWLDERIARHEEVSLQGQQDPLLVVIAGALCTSHQAMKTRVAEYTSQLSRGQLPSTDLLSQEDIVELILKGKKYHLRTCRSGPLEFTIYCNGSYVRANIRELSDGGYLLVISDKSLVAYTSTDGNGLRLVLDGTTSIFTQEYNPTTLKSTVAGKLARYLVKNNTKVRRGMPYAEVEVMKMYMPLLTKEAGIINFEKQEGAILCPGDCIATMQLDDPSCVKQAESYTGVIDTYSSSPAKSIKVLFRLQNALKILHKVLDGFIVPDPCMEGAIEELFSLLQDPKLMCDEIMEELSKISSRIPARLYTAISNLISTYLKSKSEQQLDVGQISTLIEDHGGSTATLEPLLAILKTYENGLFSKHVSIMESLIGKYVFIEKKFSGKTIDENLMTLRREHIEGLDVVYPYHRSHALLSTKNNVVQRLLEDILRTTSNVAHETAQDIQQKAPLGINCYAELLKSIADLKHKSYSTVSLEARHLLVNQNTMTFEERQTGVQKKLCRIANACDATEKTMLCAELVDMVQPINDLLISEAVFESQSIALCALEIYVQRIYRSYDLHSAIAKQANHFSFVKFEFTDEAEEPLHVGRSKRRTSDAAMRDGVVLDAQPIGLRHGVLASFKNLQALFDEFDSVLNMFPGSGGASSMLSGTKCPIRMEPIHVLHFAIYAEKMDEEHVIQEVEKFLILKTKLLQTLHIRRLTFAIAQFSAFEMVETEEYRYSGIYTFRHRLNYREDPIVRHMEAPLAYLLELKRLSNYNVDSIASKNKNIHIYMGTAKKTAIPTTSSSILKRRLFARGVVRHTDHSDADFKLEAYDAHPGPERTFVDALNALELVMGSNSTGQTIYANNHIFLSVLPVAVVDPQYIEAVIRILANRYGDRLQKLCVSQVEFKINARFTEEAPKIPIRLVATNPTGFVLRVDTYVEAKDSHVSENEGAIFTSIGDDCQGELDGMPVTTPYPVSQIFDQSREAASKLSDTLFVYDFLELFDHCIARVWTRYIRERAATQPIQMPRKLLDYVELILEGDQLVESSRSHGKNDIGMVAWLLTLYTPEFPFAGRQIVLIANDITFKAGSFGTLEDKLFNLASKLARKKGCPRVYLAANAGARIGMAESVKQRYKICWKDARDVSKGFDYLYLSKEDYLELSSVDAVVADMKLVDGEERYVIQDIIGEESDIGVENLQGSGGIAGETSRAFHDIMTLTYVCGRSVGIGAYLVRLGQRTIQKDTNAPIILTGYQALNKLMGKSVYSSNEQLGGVNIMHTNGVSHLTVSSHLDGVLSILKWLSFVPAVRDGPLPISDISGVDSVDREIDFQPGKSPYDPRHLLMGCLDELSGTWQTGFTDRGSFVEILGGWAKSVVVGRARLGGIPIGVIISEVRTAQKITPADPAAPSTQENMVHQAGQVWFPDSAHKTATAIGDFNGENLPLMIFANWRGFSGGQRDMFDEVLKYGAAIVDNLVAYKQPVFVYIPPFAELRGGAWVVVDPTINAEYMEMYADPNGRGGVLEPAGLIEIKYRKRDLMRTAHRLDEQLIELDALLEDADQASSIELKGKIEAREKCILPVYVQIATQFADLHDTPGRMKAKNAIREVVPWKSCRTYFYWRLRRRLAQLNIRRQIMKASGDSTSSVADSTLKSWFEISVQNSKHSSASPQAWEDDRLVYDWLSSETNTISRKLAEVNETRISQQVTSLGLENSRAAVQGILSLISKLDDAEGQEVITALRRGSIFPRSSSASSRLGAKLGRF